MHRPGREKRSSPDFKSRGRSSTKAQPGCFKVSNVFACGSRHFSRSREPRSRAVSQQTFTGAASLVPAETQRVAESQRSAPLGVQNGHEALQPIQVARAASRAERAVIGLVALRGWALQNGGAAHRVGLAVAGAAFRWRDRARQGQERQPSRSGEGDDADLPDKQDVLQELERCRMRLEDKDACTHTKDADACARVDTPSTRTSLGLSAEQSSPQFFAPGTSCCSDVSPMTARGRNSRRRCYSADCQQDRLQQAQELFSKMLAPSRQTCQKHEVQLPEPSRHKVSVSPTVRRWNRPRSAMSSRENAARQTPLPALEPLNGCMPRFPGLGVAEPSFFQGSEEAALRDGSTSSVSRSAAKIEASPTTTANVEFCELLTAALAEPPSLKDHLAGAMTQVAEEPMSGSNSPLKNLPRAPIPQTLSLSMQADSVEPSLPQEDSPQQQYAPPERRSSSTRSESPGSPPKLQSVCKFPMRQATPPRSRVVEVEGARSSVVETEASAHPFAPPAAQQMYETHCEEDAEEDLKQDVLQSCGSQETMSLSPTAPPSHGSNFSKRLRHRSFAEIMSARRCQAECTSVVCPVTE